MGGVMVVRAPATRRLPAVAEELAEKYRVLTNCSLTRRRDNPNGTRPTIWCAMGHDRDGYVDVVRPVV